VSFGKMNDSNIIKLWWMLMPSDHVPAWRVATGHSGVE